MDECGGGQVLKSVDVGTRKESLRVPVNSGTTLNLRLFGRSSPGSPIDIVLSTRMPRRGSYSDPEATSTESSVRGKASQSDYVFDRPHHIHIMLPILGRLQLVSPNQCPDSVNGIMRCPGLQKARNVYSILFCLPPSSRHQCRLLPRLVAYHKSSSTASSMSSEMTRVRFARVRLFRNRGSIVVGSTSSRPCIYRRGIYKGG